jgi:hypothetical protein
MMAVGVGVLSNLFVYMPLFLVWMGGLIFAGTIWSRHRSIAILLASACLLALLTDLVGGLLSASFPFLYSRGGRSASQLGIIFAIVGVIRSLMMATAWGLVFAAVWRGVSSQSPARAE